jgi:hypothetical protein
MWPSPGVFPVPILVAQPWDRCATPSRVLPIMNRIPSGDPSPDRDDHRDGSVPSELAVTRPKAAFQWPPDCSWPFIEPGRPSDT